MIPRSGPAVWILLATTLFAGGSAPVVVPTGPEVLLTGGDTSGDARAAMDAEGGFIGLHFDVFGGSVDARGGTPAGLEPAFWFGGGARGASVVGDRRRLSAALDNLIANALEHGSGGVRLRTRSTGSAVKVEVAESDRARAVAPPRGPRRGNGLRLAARIAAEHGGALAPPRPDGGRTVAGIELPLAGPAPGSRAG